MAAYTTIDDPSAYFKVQLYTGDGSTPSITFDDTDTDMQPDLVWIKNRDQSDSHCVFDAVRGATEVLHADANTAEVTDADSLTSFDSDGFALGADVKVNTNTEAYVAWCWKANGAGSSNTAGSINTTATSANTTAGFSISTYTGTGQSGATIGHGLGAVPHLIICKKRGATGNWATYHHKNTSAPATDYLWLDTTAATADDAGYWNDTDPTSVLFTVGDNSRTNGIATMVAYAWAGVQGFSKFGSYTGNGNADGPFIYTGFRPAFLIIKQSGVSGSSWHLYDNKRSPFNVVNDLLYANTIAAEGSDYDLDFLSNGFKIVEAVGAGHNTDNYTYLYWAFAEAPFVNSNGVPCNAR